MAKDQQGLALAGAPEFGRRVRSRDRRLLWADRRSRWRPQICAWPATAILRWAASRLRRSTMIGGFRGDHPEVMSALRAAEAAVGSASERERRHLAAAKAWGQRQTSKAIVGWEAILADHPTDALALRLVQDAYFFLGRSAAIRDCAERVMPAWDRDNPLTSFVLGLYAFGLEETGDLKRAERLRSGGAGAQSARRLGDACAGPRDGDREPA